MPVRKAVVVVVALVFGTSHAVIGGQTLMAVDAGLGAGASLHVVDATSGASSFATDLTHDYYDIAFDSTSNTLFGVSQDGDLVAIDATAIGGSGVTESIVATLTWNGVPTTIRALAVDPTGQLFGIDLEHNLHQIDKATGELTGVGPTDLSTLYALAFEPTTGILYASTTFFGGIVFIPGQLYTIDPATGDPTEIGLTQNSLSFAFAADGTLYGADSGDMYQPPLAEPSTLLTIDTATGDATAVGLTVLENIIGIAFVSYGPGPDGLEFQRGDSNSDGGLDISDAIFTLSTLFVPGSPTSPCGDAADANDDGGIDIADAIATLSVLFVAGTPPLPEPSGVCGADPTEDDLDCSSSSACP